MYARSNSLLMMLHRLTIFYTWTSAFIAEFYSHIHSSPSLNNQGQPSNAITNPRPYPVLRQLYSWALPRQGEPFFFILRINVILDKVSSTNKYEVYFPEYCVIMSSFLTEDIPMEFSARHNRRRTLHGVWRCMAARNPQTSCVFNFGNKTRYIKIIAG